MSDVIRFSGVTVNAPDAFALARFYADPAGHPFCLSTWDTPELED